MAGKRQRGDCLSSTILVMETTMTEDKLRRYRDCAHALAEVADPFIKRRLLDLARRYEDTLQGKTVKPRTIANLPERQWLRASHS